MKDPIASTPQRPPLREKPAHDYALLSIALFLASITAVALTTLFERRLAGLSMSAERWLGFATIVLPAAIGACFGIAGIASGRRRALCAAALALNALVAAFFALVLSFAG
jgi:hypothetical protein